MEKVVNIRKAVTKFIDTNIPTFNITEGPKSVHKFVKTIFEELDDAVEYVIVLLVDSQLKVIGYSIVSQGTFSQTSVNISGIMRHMLAAATDKYLVVHNHPCGSLEISKEDIMATKTIMAAGNLMGFELIDHVIFTTDSYTSIRDSGGFEFTTTSEKAIVNNELTEEETSSLEFSKMAKWKYVWNRILLKMICEK